jgi:putative peptidoglycan lipid II flippase
MRAEAHRMSLARQVATVGGGTLLSRLLAYARDAGIAALLGAGPFSEAFFAVVQVVNFFRRLLAEGALNGAFVPIWLKLRADEDGAGNADRFSRRALVAMLCLTGIAALLAVVLARFVIAAVAPGFDEGRREVASLFLLIVAPYIVLAGLVAVLAAALNAENRVAAAAGSVVAFNLVMVAAVFLAFVGRLDQFGIGLWLSAAIVAAGFVQLIITAVAWLATGRRWQRAHRRVRDQTVTLFRRALPGLFAAGIPQLKLIAATAIVSSSPAAVAWLYYANRLYELPLGVASAAIAAVMVPRIAESRRSGGDGEYAAALSRACEIALGLALPAATGFALLAGLIAGGLFQHGAFTADDTAAVAAALIAICAGLPGHVLEKWLGAASFAHEDTRTPMWTALAGLAAAITFGLLLFPRFGYVGAAAAIAMSGWVGAALLGVLLARRGWLKLDSDAVHRLPRILAATLIMGAVIATLGAITQALLPDLTASGGKQLALLAALVALGLVVYVAALVHLGVVRLPQLIAALRQG